MGEQGQGSLSSEVPCQGASKRTVRSHVWARAGARGSLYSEVPCLSGIRAGTGGTLYGEVQRIMGNGCMGPPPPEQNDRYE